ncbi:hypothetical protein QA645_41180 [Bradyrhizobium sp. CIAT3101]|uniref:hypothetical protein n=1 Tax=Bradyrhizobium sp. CIAT3101 TaxID=439387 RepID=UPI0024B12A43|nr:hypothetical protein [Bradyrhizobium sp. CIAT3101]WFU80760.1 hypothetical protein QA645_41180 [Bradyrhizobium sp. CIAT3101]
MRQYVAVSDEERNEFWDALPHMPDADPPQTARTELLSSLPPGAQLERFARRRKGGGSLGRPRFVAIARWQGGFVVREAKALIPSGWSWSEGGSVDPTQLSAIILGPSRSPDPFLRVGSHFLVRRISPDARKVERSSAFDRKLDAKLLSAMALEIGSIHSQSSGLSSAILECKILRDGTWLNEAAKELAGLVQADYEEWKAI